MGFTILGTGSALPKRSVSNDELSEFLDTSDEWIFTRTGIKSRRVCTTESLDDLAVAASEQALQVSGIDASQLDLIVCSTTTGDHLVPAEACAVAERLGATCPAFDVSAACAGFVFALDVAEGYIARGRAEHALVVAAEQMTRALDWTDRATCVLFGDGAGAVVLEWDESAPGILASFLKNTDDDTLCLTVDANHDMSTFPFGENVGNVGVGEIMNIETDEGGFAEHAAFIRMHGQRVFKFATAAIVEAAREVCERAGVSMDEVSCIVPHQANDRIIRFAAKKLGVPYERWQVSIAEAGNTSASSVLMALSDAYDSGRIQPGDMVMCVGFGGGLTSGALLFEA